MSIFVNKDTKVIVQGITGRIGRFHGVETRAFGGAELQFAGFGLDRIA